MRRALSLAFAIVILIVWIGGGITMLMAYVAGVVIVSLFLWLACLMCGERLPLLEKTLLMIGALANLLGATFKAIDIGLIVFRRELQAQSIDLESTRVRLAEERALASQGDGNWNHAAPAGAEESTR